MSADKITKARVKPGGRHRSGNHSRKGQVVRKNGHEAIKHCVSCFAHRDDPQISSAAKVVFDFPAAEHAIGRTNAPRNGGGNVQRFQRSLENLPGELFSVHGGGNQCRFSAVLQHIRVQQIWRALALK